MKSFPFRCFHASFGSIALLIPLGLSLCSVSFAQDPPIRHGQADWWAEQAMHFASSPDGISAHDDVAIGLAESYAFSGDLSRLWTLEREVKDKEQARGYLPWVAHHLVVAGRIDEANQVVAHLDAEYDREQIAEILSSAYARRHDFDRAAQLISEISDVARRNTALERLAKAQAESGRWDDAATTLGKITIPEDLDSEQRKYLKEDIARLGARILRCRANKVSRPPEPLPADAASSYRAALSLWGFDSTVDDVDRARAQIDRLTDPEKLATGWRGVAWFHAKKGAQEDALDALSRGVNAAKKIAEPYAKSVNLILIADIYLELGENDAAVALIPEALSSEQDMMKMMRGLTGFTTGPVIVGVLVRSGHADRALKMLRSAKSEPSVSWIAFGEFCAETGQLAYAAQLLDEPLTAASKAYLAGGVANSLVRARATHAEIQER